MTRALRFHWPEYLMEAADLVPDGVGRRAAMGLAMGLTNMALIYSPWGQQSGAHMNPSVTLTYLRLRKVERLDACGYVLAQFVGGIAGVLLVRAALGMLAAHPAVRFAVTAPGSAGPATAFAAEATISFVLMSVVLVASNAPRLARFTPLLCGGLVAAYITLEAPLSGMSMNPARSFASAVVAWQWNALWIYFTAPPLGMLAAAEAYVLLRGPQRVLCAKLNHRTARRCIFRCNFGALDKA